MRVLSKGRPDYFAWTRISCRSRSSSSRSSGSASPSRRRSLDQGKILYVCCCRRSRSRCGTVGYSRSWYLSLLATCGGAYARSARGLRGSAVLWQASPTLRQLIRGLNGSIQSAYGCAVGSLMLFSQLSTTYQPFKEVWHGDPINGYKTVWVKREGSRSYVRTAVSPIRA
jgi:hypothetical protein